MLTNSLGQELAHQYARQYAGPITTIVSTGCLITINLLNRFDAKETNHKVEESMSELSTKQGKIFGGITTLNCKIDKTNDTIASMNDNLSKELMYTQYLGVEAFLLSIDNQEKRQAMADRFEKFIGILRWGGKGSETVQVKNSFFIICLNPQY